MDAIPEVERPRETEYLNCIRCGLCLAVCPTYREHLSEPASPRGRVVLARKSLEGELKLTTNLLEQMNACFACLACNEICPVGIRPAELVLAMRYVGEQTRRTGWKQLLFGGMIPNPGRMETATLPLRIYERSGLRKLFYQLGVGRLLPEKVRDLEAMLPHLPRRPLRQSLPEVTEALGQSRYRVGFFLGCVQNLLYPDESKATVRVLARNGCTVITPREVQCCGMPARGYGRLDLVRQQAKHNIELYEKSGVEVIVTDCATCGSTLKDYVVLLQDEAGWEARAQAFSAKVRDVSEFLADIPLEKPTERLQARLTYHDPCHLRRGQKVWQQPRYLLSLVDGLEFVELPEADWCCGSAGSQLITHYQTSVKVMERKLDNLVATGAQVVASGCPGCQMQLNSAVRRRGLNLRVTHPIMLLDEAYRTDNAA
ncbi:MAG: (Fe-S)-binding protein [Anaerolineales bacterium]|nr:MAG: (Fe-S)-binding protein [Anaerolineales bacterium]